MRNKIIAIFLFLFSMMSYGQNKYDEEKENKIYQLEEYQEIKSEIEEKILYVKKVIEVGSDIHKNILVEYEELNRELEREIEILKQEIKQ